MTDITTSAYTSEESFDVIVPDSLTGGVYSIDVSGTSPIGSAEFTVLGAPVITPYNAVPSSKMGIVSVTQSYVITADADILTGAIALSAGSPASISTINQIDTHTITLSLLVTANGDVGLSATDVLGQTTTNIITDYVIYAVSPFVNGQGPGIKFTNHDTYDRFLLTNEEPGSVHVTITDNIEMIYDAITPSDWIVLVDGSVGEIDPTSWVQTTSAVVDFDVINISATGNITISAMNYWDSFTNEETDGRWNVGCSDNDRLINLVDFLPQHLYDSETYDFTKLFENFLNTMYENKDDPCNVSILKKIEQIGDLHDPQLMDTEYLQYFADFLGYDLTLNVGELGYVTGDLVGEEVIVNEEESQKYMRFVVENLPNWYKIKSTNNAIKIMLFSFGVIGDLFTLFTNDYDKNWISERGNDLTPIGSEMPSDYYPTPHFVLGVNLRETPPTWLQNAGTILSSIESIKPINTVFERYHGYYTLDPANISVNASKPTITQRVFIDWPNNTATKENLRPFSTGKELFTQAEPDVLVADWFGGATQGTGLIGDSFVGNGTDAYIDMGQRLNPPSTYLGLSIFFKTPISTDSGYIASLGTVSTSPRVYINNVGDIYLNFFDSLGGQKIIKSASSSYNDNEWHNLFISLDVSDPTNEPIMILDGVDFGVVTQNDSFGTINYSNFLLGKWTGSLTYFTGEMCDFYWSTNPEFANHVNAYATSAASPTPHTNMYSNGADGNLSY